MGENSILKGVTAMFRKIFQKRGQVSGLPNETEREHVQPDEAERKEIYRELIEIQKRERDAFARDTAEQAARSGVSITNAVVQNMFRDNAKAPPYHLSAIAKIQAKCRLSERQVEDIYKEFSGSSYF
jgi:hypothetical protein